MYILLAIIVFLAIGIALLWMFGPKKRIFMAKAAYAETMYVLFKKNKNRDLASEKAEICVMLNNLNSSINYGKRIKDKDYEILQQLKDLELFKENLLREKREKYGED